MKKTFTFCSLFLVLCFVARAQQVMVETTPNTSCAVPNGSATASVDGSTLGYTFEWYTADSTPIGSSGPVVTNLAAGNYLVIVRDASTSAVVGTAQGVVMDAITLFEVTVQSAANTTCTVTPNGSLTALINGVAAGPDYVFAWYAGTVAEGTVIATGPSLTQQAGGTFTVQVTNIITGCFSTVSAVIADAPSVPVVVTINSVSNTNCLSSNGSLTVTTQGPATDYTFAWYAGTEIFDPVLSTNATLSNVVAGNYTVAVTDVISGCVTVATASVAEDCQFSNSGNDIIHNQKKADPSVSFYPNPASTTLFIVSQVNASVSLIDKDGTNLGQLNVSPSATPFAFDVSNVKSGKYFLLVREAATTRSYQVVVKK